MTRRASPAPPRDLGRAETVGEHNLVFDVWSGGNGCAASDLVPTPGTDRHAWGVIYEVPEECIRGRNHPEGKTMEEIECPRYEPKPIRVRKPAGEEVEATTFLVKARDRSTGLWTSVEYVRHTVCGLRAHDAPEEYVQHVIDTAIETNCHSVTPAEDQSRLIAALRDPTPTSSGRSRSDP